MKKKIFSILFALVLVLSFSLIPAMPAVADEGDSSISLFATGNGTAEWVTDPVKVGDYAVKLQWPPGDRTEVRILISSAPTISQISAWDFWTISPASYTLPVEFLVDTTGDGEMDTIIAGTTLGDHSGDWFNETQDTISMYMVWNGSGYDWLNSWAVVQQDYGNATLMRVDLGFDPLGSNETITAYADDFTMTVDGDTTTYEFEPPLTCYVSTTGSDNNLGTEEEPFATIQRGVNIVAEGGTVHVAAGTYEEGITGIDKNLAIIGATTPSRPVIKPTEDTGTTNEIGPNGRGWFQIHNGATVSFENLVFDGTGQLVHTAVHYHEDSGGGTVESCDFMNIAHTPSGYNGRGINNYGQHVEVLNCTFSNIYRIGVFTYNSGATTLISGCTYTGKGDGDWLDYAFEAGAGGNITVENNTVTACTGVASVDDSTSAGILVTTYYGESTQATITGNTISNSTGGIAVGYDENDTSTVVAHNNDITGNTAYGLTSTSPAVDATNNWWGHATGPKHATTNPDGRGGEVSDNVDYAHWYLVPKDDVLPEAEVEETDYGQDSQEFSGTDTTVDTTGTSGDGDITVKTYDYTVPEDAEASLAVSVEGGQALKYVDVKLENSNYSGNVCVTISYTDADLAQMGVKEDTLKLYYFSMPDGPWTEATNQSLDTVNNTVSGCIPASELTGTPLCLGGEAEATGQYEVGEPPTVTVTFIPTEMDPQFEQTVTVVVSVPAGKGRTLEELTEVLFKVWHDNNGGPPTETEFNGAMADTQTGAIITWGPPDNFILTAMSGTTWLLGTCNTPTLTGTSATFTLKFTPGKVATETTVGPVWQIAATATSEYGTGFGYDAEATAMNWYGELALEATVNVDWGSVPANLDFDNILAKEALGTAITYISNGGYSQKVKSSATWEGIGNTATLDATGNCATEEYFALKADNTDTLPDNTHLLNTTGTEFDTGAITTEVGNEESANYLWLKLASTFATDTYSGIITYIIQNG